MRNVVGPTLPTKTWLPLIVLLAGLAVAPGCSTHQVRTPDSDRLTETYKRETPQALFWGLVLKPQVVAADCKAGLNDVVVKDNFLYDLASVLTLGIWMPSEVEYRCRAPSGSGGSFPEAPKRP